MTQRNWNRVQEIFDRIVASPRGERTALLEKTCAGDEHLRAEVKSLLEQDNHVGDDFLRPPEPLDVPGVDEPEQALPAGTRIGRYTIEAVLAAGGMGTVYRAVQDEPHRSVALKLMKQNVASRSALRRFQLEANLLGTLHHPNVAQVYEAGMHEREGVRVPYFAMEYIPDAKSLTQFADERRLDTAERLALLAKVCDAVHHGHQKGIIHRDLKPSNILVDADGEPKVIDFGIARATDSDIAVTTMQTDAGQLLGTLQYMSPEQCNGSAADIDTRSDVYSLGVVLYELLCGRPPYDVSDTTLVNAVRLIAERSPDAPSSIHRRLRGNIETVLLKALKKDREQRYASAAGLGADIRRILAHEPISVRPPTVLARAAHWVVRHPLVTTAAVCVAMLAFTVGATYVTVWWLKKRPYRIVVLKRPGLENSRSAYEAQLIALSGRPIKTWSGGIGGDQVHRIAIAAMRNRPGKLGGGRVVVLGFMRHENPEYSRALLALDADGDLDQPLWVRRVETSQIPLTLRVNRGYSAADFGINYGKMVDVFPDRPGEEIVVVFGHRRNSQRVLRIYDLAGELLYQIWNDGDLSHLQWLADSGVLIVAGDYQKDFFTPNGDLIGEKSKEFVVFALRPEVGFIDTEILDPRHAERPSHEPVPVWFKCLRPYDPADTWPAVSLSAETRSGHSGSHALLTIYSGNPIHALGVKWVIDQFGEEVPGTRDADDAYDLNRKLPDDDPRNLHLPDPSVFHLEPYPMKK